MKKSSDYIDYVAAKKLRSRYIEYGCVYGAKCGNEKRTRKNDCYGDLHYFTNDSRPELNEIGLRKVVECKADLIASGKYSPELQVKSIIPYLEMRASDLQVSAGTGNFLDEDYFEIIPFPASSILAGADLGIRIAGDSMESRLLQSHILPLTPPYCRYDYIYCRWLLAIHYIDEILNAIGIITKIYQLFLCIFTILALN